MRKRRGMAALLAALCLFLSGCAGQATVEELLRAPQLSPRLGVVQKALNAYLGESAQLKYPQGGEMASPFLFSDLDGDGQEEAVVLYQSESKGLNVHLAVLEQKDENWMVAQEAEGLAGDIITIAVADLQGGGSHELVAVYGNSTGEDYLSVYAYADETLESIYSRACSCYLLTDLTGSGTQDLVLATKKNDGISLEMLTSKEGAFQPVQELPLDKRLAGCTALVYSKGFGGERCVVLDGTDQSGYTVSDMIRLDEETGQLKTYHPAALDLLTKTARLKPGLSSIDIDGDGTVEVPVEEGDITTVSTSRRLSFLTWHDFTRRAYSTVRFGILDSEYGYFVRLPAHLMDEVMVVDGPLLGSWEVRSANGEYWYITVVVRNKDKTELPPSLEEYTVVRAIGSDRILVRINTELLSSNVVADILQGIRLL